jgi:hypothetical protein
LSASKNTHAPALVVATIAATVRTADASDTSSNAMSDPQALPKRRLIASATGASAGMCQPAVQQAPECRHRYGAWIDRQRTRTGRADV